MTGVIALFLFVHVAPPSIGAQGQRVAGAAYGIGCGDRIQVINASNADGERLLVRTAPCANVDQGECGALSCNTFCGRVWAGAQGRVTSEPFFTPNNGYVWWRVRWDSGWPDAVPGYPVCANREGYSVEGCNDGSEQWLTVIQGGCCSNADCDDGNACTTDTCVNYACQHSGNCLGACCVEASCTLTTPAACSGTWTGETSCNLSTCQASTGACCINNFCYTGYSQLACGSQGGTWQGAGTNSCSNCPARYSLTLQSNPSDGGAIAANPPPGGDGKYAFGTQVQLVAYANSGFTLSSWSGSISGSTNPATVTMSSNRSVAANFGIARDGILKIEPATAFLPIHRGGDQIEPSSTIYTLSNIGGHALDWTVSSWRPEGLPPWLGVSAMEGTLESGERTTVTLDVLLSEVPPLLCRHKDYIVFNNATNGAGTEKREVTLTAARICDPVGTGQPIEASIPDSIAKIVMRESRFLRWNFEEQRFDVYPHWFVPIDLSQETFILAHGWDGSPGIWGPTAQQLQLQYAEWNQTPNILAWDWSLEANPNRRRDLSVLSIVDNGLGGTFLLAIIDAAEANENAKGQANKLAKLLRDYPALGTEFHFIGKSLGGGLLAHTASILEDNGVQVDSLTMIDSPQWACIASDCRVDAMKYLRQRPGAASKSLVFYYDEHLGSSPHCGFGAPGPYPAINLRLNPENYDPGAFPHCMHEDITEPEQWFPKLLQGTLVLDGMKWNYPRDISALDSSRWYSEEAAGCQGETCVGAFEPMGACCSFALFDEGCTETLETECSDVGFPYEVYMGDHTHCSDQNCGDGEFTAQSRQDAGAPPAAAAPVFPGTVTLLSLFFEDAAEWKGDNAVVAKALDPGDSDNNVVLLQENGDAAFYRDFLWPQNGVLLTFDYMFRGPRGDENLTVYLDDEIVYYDHAGTSLATGGLTLGPSVFLSDHAGGTSQLAFVLRTDGTPGGGVLIDNIRIRGFRPTDLNGDSLIDLRDYAVVQRCFGSAPPQLECMLADFDKSNSVALADHAAIQECLTGPAIAGDPGCNAPPVCGNGFIEAGEECDPPNGRACSTICSIAKGWPSGEIVGWGLRVVRGDLGDTYRKLAVEGGLMALRDDGSILAWGANPVGQCNVPEPNGSFSDIAGGHGHSVGLKSDGSVVAWGSNQWGQTDVPVGGDFVAVAAGGFHSLALTSKGVVVAWGCQDSNGNFGQCDVPIPNSQFRTVAAGVTHSIGVKNDGSVVLWGCGPKGRADYGQCDAPSPNSEFLKVVGGNYHNVGLKVDGTVVAWGCKNTVEDYGQCEVPSAKVRFIDIAAGPYHSAGLTSDGAIIAWGAAGFPPGELALPDVNSGFVAVSPSLALRADGSVIEWALPWSVNVPHPNANFVAVASGESHTLGLKQDGAVVGWAGWNPSLLGQDAIPDSAGQYVEIAAGFAHSLALRADGSIMAFGSNYFGEADVPVPNTGFVTIAAAGFHSLGLRADGSIAAWGHNEHAQLDVVTPNAGFVEIDASNWHSLGLRADGTIAVWGCGMGADWGQCALPIPNSGFVAIAAGERHNLGLRADGSIVSWGNNEYGQTVIPFPNEDYVAIAAGSDHSAGLKTDGSIVSWGAYYSAWIDDQSMALRFDYLSSGKYGLLAIRGR